MAFLPVLLFVILLSASVALGNTGDLILSAKKTCFGGMLLTCEIQGNNDGEADFMSFTAQGEYAGATHKRQMFRTGKGHSRALEILYEPVENAFKHYCIIDGKQSNALQLQENDFRDNNNECDNLGLSANKAGPMGFLLKCQIQGNKEGEAKFMQFTNESEYTGTTFSRRLTRNEEDQTEALLLLPETEAVGFQYHCAINGMFSNAAEIQEGEVVADRQCQCNETPVWVTPVTVAIGVVVIILVIAIFHFLRGSGQATKAVSVEVTKESKNAGASPMDPAMLNNSYGKQCPTKRCIPNEPEPLYLKGLNRESEHIYVEVEDNSLYDKPY